MTIAWILVGICLSIMVMQKRSGGRKSCKIEVEERSNIIQYGPHGVSSPVVYHDGWYPNVVRYRRMRRGRCTEMKNLGDGIIKTLLVLLEHEDRIMQYLIDADEINYTTKAVCLIMDNKIVAYFRRDNVISISRYNGDSLTDFYEEQNK